MDPLSKGDVQIIRSGNGISHAEEIDKNSEIFQIWFDPDLKKSLKKMLHMMIINQVFKKRVLKIRLLNL